MKILSVHRGVLVVLVLAVNLAIALLGRGSFASSVAVLGTVVYVGIPSALVALVLFIVRRRYRTERMTRAFAVIAMVASSTIVGGLAGGALLARDIDVAKRYCKSIVPELERYREMHGIYPPAIGLVSAPAPPRLFRQEGGYSSDGRSFSFWFVNPGGLMNGYAYDSRSRMWSEWD